MSPLAREAKLAMQLVIRDWRAGELHGLLLALTVAVTALTATGLLHDRLEGALARQAATFLGADLSVSGHQPPLPAWKNLAGQLGLASSETAEFPSVLVENSEILLVSVKAVSDGYPLRGTLATSLDKEASTPLETHAIPAPGEVWVDRRVLDTLNIRLGSIVTIGEKALAITRIVFQEPDQRGNLYRFSPRVLMNLQDLPATRVIQPGSQVHYQVLFSGDPGPLRQLKEAVRPQLLPGQKLTDIHDDRPELGQVLQRTERFMAVASIAVVLIAGVAIALAVQRYAARHADLIAMLKCLGATRREITRLLLLQLGGIGLAGSMLGCLGGWGMENLMTHLLGTLLPDALPTPGPRAWLSGAGSGLLILAGFGLPPMLALNRVTPMQALRKETRLWSPETGLTWTAALATLILLLFWLLEDSLAIAGMLASGVILLGGLALAGVGVIRLARYRLPRLGLPVRLALRQLTHHPRLAIIQTMAFSLTLAAALITLLLRNELIRDWQQQTPARAPNHFAMNLFDSDLDRFREFLHTHTIPASETYPIVRGRLVKVNGQDVASLTRHDTRAEGALNRELGLTWTVSLPTGNRVVSGQWPPEPGSSGVSMEHELAQRIGVRPGDHLSFDIAGQALEATVTSTRQVEWNTLTPNFYMIFPPGILDAFPHTWLASFYLEPIRQPELAGMAKAFPGMTVVDIGKLLNELQSIVTQASLAVESMLLLALLAGLAVLFGAIRITGDTRLQEYALLRALGAGEGLLRKTRLLEFTFLGITSGFLAIILTEIILWVVYNRIMELPFHPHWPWWLLLPAAGTLLTVTVGLHLTRRIVREPPMKVLNGNT